MDAEQDAHFQLMKRLLVIIPLSTILILTILCVVLGVNLYEAKRELHALREQAAPVMAQVQTSGAETQGGELFTASGVDEFRRDTSDPDSGTSDADDGIRKVYLTFDDGPSGNTEEILDILAEYDVKATFLWSGKRKKDISRYTKELWRKGIRWRCIPTVINTMRFTSQKKVTWRISRNCRNFSTIRRVSGAGTVDSREAAAIR